MTLVGLQFNNNNLTDIGATIFSTTVRNPGCNFRLAHLRLENNKIGDKGCEALAVALNKHKSLLELELSYNPISDQGMELFMLIVSNEDSDTTIVKPQGVRPTQPPPLPPQSKHNSASVSTAAPATTNDDFDQFESFTVADLLGKKS